MSPVTSAGDLEELRKLRPFAQIARSLPSIRANKHLHVTTISRWRWPGFAARDGSRITLRAVRLPSGWATTVEWVQEFFDAVTADKAGQQPPAASIRSPVRRRREIARANRELDDIGI
jgi:hypothetical protein